MSRPELHLSSEQFIANIEAVRTRISPSVLMLVMKDDAYGHGITWAVETAQRAGVDWFGSYDVAGGVEIRRILQRPADVFAWATSTDSEIDEALMQRIDLGVGTAEYLSRVISRATVLGIRARVHLKIDTGLHRNGVLFEDWPATIDAVREAEEAGALELVGVWSHLAEASDAEDDDARQVFLRAITTTAESGPTPQWQHLTASAASWWRPELRGTLSRIGAFCYGIRSADGPELEGVLPVAELTATVIDVVDEGAVISIGSFDGLPSTLAGMPVGTERGTRIVASIDLTTSLVEGGGLEVGDRVWIFGTGTHGEATATTLAERIDTVGEEILTRLTARVRLVASD
ncbi:MAG: alanine racemase [Microbacterium sp.]|uniref:alanine racemase n=1 Tax=Microbacterium sp. TaxID=51671 RepID=UPI001DE8A8B0|nr:alanine racemase [Microbacterium sp.]MBW8763505.1 alanine racemase [Microbacterium sp.]